MAIASKRNFTITDLSKNTIVLRRCSPGGSLGSMVLTPVYGDSYSLALQYGAGGKPAWYTDLDSPGPTPTLIDLSDVDGAESPAPVNSLTAILVDKTQAVPEDGYVSATLGFSGSFDIQSGAPLRKPKVVEAELKRLAVNGYRYDYTFSTGSSSTLVITNSLSVWGIEFDKDSPVSVTTVSGVQDPDDPLKTRYTIPFSASTAPEWSLSGAARAYKYRLGDFMEGIIRLRAPGYGGFAPSPICGTSIE